LRPVFLQDGNEVSFDRARVVVFPVPYEGTVSYGGGTARGPAAIIEASTQIESFNERMISVPSTCGIWTEAPLEIPDASTEQVVRRVAERFGDLMDAGKWVVMLGGEHSITPGGVAAAAARRIRSVASTRRTTTGGRSPPTPGSTTARQIAPSGISGASDASR